MPRLPGFYYQQMRGPQGRLARAAAWWMNAGNTVINRQAVEALEAGPGLRALDVGFGGGAGLRRLIAGGTRMTGADPSVAMTRYCAERFAGRVQIVRAVVEALPFADEAFDRVLAVNTLYFWDDIARACREIGRVLGTPGRVVIATSSAATCRRFRFPEQGFHAPDEDTVSGHLRDAGFASVRVERRANLGGTRLFIGDK